MRRFYRVPTINVLEQNKKIMYTPVNLKVGCKGVFVTRTCFRDDQNEKQPKVHTHIDTIQKEKQTVNRVNSSVPKGGHSAAT